MAKTKPKTKPRKRPKPKIKAEWKRFVDMMKKGKLPDNATTRELRKFFGVKGHPLKRSLRSRKARERFNELLSKFNRERMTKPSEARKRINIRKKQKETLRKKVAKDRAAYELHRYDKILYILEAVADDISAYISYQEAAEMVDDNKSMTAKEIVEFIKGHYSKMQDTLPDNAKEPQENLDAAFKDLNNLMDTFRTSNIDKIKKLVAERASNPYKFKQKEAAQKAKNKKADTGNRYRQ